MTTEERERWILMGLPAGMVVVAYILLVHWSNSNALASAQNSWKEAEPKAVPAAVLTQAQTTNQSLETDVKRLAGEKDDFTSQKKELARNDTSGGMRVAAVARVSRFVEQHGLRVVEQKPVDATAGESLPISLVEARKRLSTDTAPAPTIWQIKLAGNYAAMTALLEDLATSEVGALPLRVTMEPPQTESPIRVWTLMLLL